MYGVVNPDSQYEKIFQLVKEYSSPGTNRGDEVEGYDCDCDCQKSKRSCVQGDILLQVDT